MAWPHLPVPLAVGVSRNIFLDAASTNARNIARTICDLRGYCGVDGGFRDRTSTYSGTVTPWQIVAATTETSRAFSRIGVIWLDPDDSMGFNSANDILAHEMGHLMDFNYAGDRASGPLETDEVEEALADMFAYEYDRFDATLGEEQQNPRINWENPGAISPFLSGQPYPAHIRDYDDTPPNEAGRRTQRASQFDHPQPRLLALRPGRRPPQGGPGAPQRARHAEPTTHLP